MRLFVERGFDDVTTAEVANAADVSSATLFNHFATKEDLVFGQVVQLETELAELVSSRAPGEPILPALRDHVLYELTAGRAYTDPPAVRSFHRLVANSSQLREREMAIFGRRQQVLAGALLAALPAAADPAEAKIAAAMFIAAEQLIGEELRRLLAEGLQPKQAMLRLEPFIDLVFAVIRDGVGSLPHS